ncbi:MAG TPA: FAD-dependent oxidoreductase [Gaiellaceae bacterium]
MAAPTGTEVSHWLARGADAPPPAAELPTEAEVVVVGGGVVGVATAYWLARRGAAPLLLEAHGLAHGASGRNGGLVLAGRSRLEDPATLRAVLREERIDADYEELGHLALASSESVLERFRDELARRPPDAPPLDVLDHAQCEDLLGMAIAPSFAGGRWLPGGALADPVRLVGGLAEAAVRHGAALATSTRVLRLTVSGDGVRIETTRGRVRAERVVVACGFRTAELVGAGGLLRPVRGQMLSTEPAPPLFRPGMALDFGTVYWRQARDGAIVAGGCNHVDFAAEATARTAVNPRIQAALERFFAESFPGLPPLAVARRWAGIMDETLDGRPVVGRWQSERVWLAAGFGGHGLPPALGVGRALAAALAGEPARELEPLSPERFAENGAEVAA